MTQPAKASHANPPPVSEPVRAAGGRIPKGGISIGMPAMLGPPVKPMGGNVPGLLSNPYDISGPLERPY